MTLHGIPATAAGLVLLSALQIAALVLALYAAPWRQLRAVSTRLHLAGGGLVILLLLWSVKASLEPAIEVHLLGTTALTLLLGLPLALTVGALAQGVQVLLGRIELAEWLPQTLFNVTVPALLTSAMLHALARLQLRNLFFYLLGLGFFGAALSALASYGLLLTLMWAEGAELHRWPASVLFLLCFPEGFVNGAVVSILAVYKPHWMRTYDDHYFLDHG